MIVEFFGSGGSGGGGGTNTNLATNELIQANTTRSFRTAGSGYLTFNQNDGTNVVKILDTGAFEIGGASPYSMPTARGTTGELLRQTTTGGQITFQTLTTPSSSSTATTISDVCQPITEQGIGQITTEPRLQDIFAPNRNGTPTASLSSILGALAPSIRWSDLAILQNGALYETGSLEENSAGRPEFFWIKHWNTSPAKTFGRFVLVSVNMATDEAFASLTFVKTILLNVGGLGETNTKLVCDTIENELAFTPCTFHFLGLEVLDTTECSFGFNCGGGGTITTATSTTTTTTTPTYS